MKPHSFKGLLKNVVKRTDTDVVTIPPNIEKIFGSRRQVRSLSMAIHTVGIIANMGAGSPGVGVRKDIRKAIGKKIGDTLMVTIEEVSPI